MTFFAANSLLARWRYELPKSMEQPLRQSESSPGRRSPVVTSFRPGGIGAVRRHGFPAIRLRPVHYAITFSFAYRSLDAGTGSLVLFAAVQMTMLGLGIASGERPQPSEWTVWPWRLGDLIYLVSRESPRIPDWISLMTVAGAAWGYYSLAARKVSSPIAATAGNSPGPPPRGRLAHFVIWQWASHASWFGSGWRGFRGGHLRLAYALW